MPPKAAARNPWSVVNNVVSSDCDSTGQSATRVWNTIDGAGST